MCYDIIVNNCTNQLFIHLGSMMLYYYVQPKLMVMQILSMKQVTRFIILFVELTTSCLPMLLKKSTLVQRVKELGYANKLCVHTGYMLSFKLKNTVPPATKLFHTKGCQNYKSCC